MKDELQSIISGNGKVRYGAGIQAITSYLRGSQETSKLAKDSKHFKIQETKILINYISEHDLFFNEIDIEKYISEGAEQKVYLKDGETVIKLNDSIFFNSWLDYLNNLLCHNFFFPVTAYNLLGFHLSDTILYAVVSQQFIKATSGTNLELVKEFLLENGFINTRNNDYINNDLNIILEDLHDENVLTENDVLQFIDTVFYIQPEFYSNLK